MDRAQLARLLGVTSHVGEPRSWPATVEEPDPGRFMAAFAAAVGEGGPVFLADPAWGATARAQLAALLAQSSNAPAEGGRGWLMIASGGTGGALKFVRHDEETLSAAVLGFCGHFAVKRVNAVGVLPLHHVSGLVAWMRCVLTGGEYRPWDWKRLEAGEPPTLPVDGDWFLSLVPTQLQRLLALPDMVIWLRQFRAIFVGGGPAWPELAELAARAELPLSLSYGMSETAAMVAAQRPADFLAGRRNCGSPLPHARIEITAAGSVKITGDSVFRGYWPDCRQARDYETEDLGHLDERGELQVLGRRDAMIITGGKKVAPVEVEAVLRATGEFADVAVVGVPNAEWGQAVVACYPAGLHGPDWKKVERFIAERLAAHMRPKRFMAIAVWPRNAQGKVNRAELSTAISANVERS